MLVINFSVKDTEEDIYKKLCDFYFSQSHFYDRTHSLETFCHIKKVINSYKKRTIWHRQENRRKLLTAYARFILDI